MDKLRKAQLIIFLLSGSFFLVVALFFSRTPSTFKAHFLIPFLISIGSVLAGVALVDYVWALLASDEPVSSLCKIVDKAHKIGIVDFWRARSEDAGSRREEYVKYIEKAKEIDLMGLNLANDIFDVDMVKDKLAQAIKNKATIRILISEPDIEKSRISQQRLSEPGERIGERGEVVFPKLLEEAQEGIGDICKKVDRPGKFIDNIRVADKSVIYCMVIRMGEQIFVSNYLSSVVGNEAPGMWIRRMGDAGLFEVYRKEFERTWVNGRTLTDKERERLLKT